MEDTMKLGGDIELSGFNELDNAQMVVLKKIVGNYARKMSDLAEKFESLSLVMKSVHETEASKKYEVHAKLMSNGRPVTSELTDRNVFVAVDSSLKKIVAEIGK